MLILVALLSQSLTAEETFRKIEEKALQAKTLRMKFRSGPAKDGKGPATSGTWSFRGDKLSFLHRFHSPVDKDFRVVVDGARMYYKDNRDEVTQEAPKNLVRLHRILLVRFGAQMAFMCLYSPYHPGYGKGQDPLLEENYKLTDFAQGPDEGPLKSLTYMASILGADKPIPCRLLYDPKTLKIAGSRLKAEKPGSDPAGEPFESFETEVELADDLFKIPPG